MAYLNIRVKTGRGDEYTILDENVEKAIEILCPDLDISTSCDINEEYDENENMYTTAMFWMGEEEYYSDDLQPLEDEEYKLAELESMSRCLDGWIALFPLYLVGVIDYIHISDGSQFGTFHPGEQGDISVYENAKNLYIEIQKQIKEIESCK